MRRYCKTSKIIMLITTGCMIVMIFMGIMLNVIIEKQAEREQAVLEHYKQPENSTQKTLYTGFVANIDYGESKKVSNKTEIMYQFTPSSSYGVYAIKAKATSASTVYVLTKNSEDEILQRKAVASLTLSPDAQGIRYFTAEKNKTYYIYVEADEKADIELVIN